MTGRDFRAVVQILGAILVMGKLAWRLDHQRAQDPPPPRLVAGLAGMALPRAQVWARMATRVLDERNAWTILYLVTDLRHPPQRRRCGCAR